MASQDREGARNCNKLKDEHDLQMKTELLLKMNHQSSSRKSRSNIHDTSVNAKPPAKKQKMINKDDPFEYLLPELGDEILKYLTPIELLKAMEVSKTWKYFIESRGSRMSKVMNKIVVKFEAENVNAIGRMTRGRVADLMLASKRNYKHMKADFGIQLVTFKFPFVNYASTLVNLELTCKSHKLEEFPKGVTFKTLRALFIFCEGQKAVSSNRHCPHKFLLDFIKASSFPEVIYLVIFEFNRQETSFNQLIEKFPKLKAIMIPTAFVGRGWGPELRYTKFENQPKLETMGTLHLYRELLIGFKDTLKEVFIYTFYEEQFSVLLENLGNLRFLYIGSILITERQNQEEEGEELFLPSNESVLLLGIGKFILPRPLAGRPFNENEMNRIHRFIQAFSALESLYLDHPHEHTIQFLVSNMMNLKKFVCGRASDEALALHANLRANGNELLNANFELTVDSIDNLIKSYKGTKLRIYLDLE